MQRLIQPEDLQKYPELLQRGISVNQHFDLDAYIQQKGNSIPPSAPIPPQLITKQDEIVAKKITDTKPKAKESKPKTMIAKKQEVVKVKKTAPKKITPIKTAPKKATKGKK